MLKTAKLFFCLFVLFCAVLTSVSVRAETFFTSARQAILMDYETGTILYEKNADERTPTSSMSKVLTAIVIFDALKDGRLNLNDTLPVSENAWRKGGSKMFVANGSRVKVDDLLKGVIVQSGNDATIVLAEGVAGSEEAFARMLNDKAREIGMENSHFANASGWPDPDHYSTARDLLKLGRYLVENYPEFYHYYAMKEFTYNKIKQTNRNPLLYKAMGVDGIKTGHTEAAGYGLMASAVQSGRRLVMVLNGMDSQKTRADESARLLGWGFAEFKNKDLFKMGDVIASIPVWMGSDADVPLTVSQDLKVSIPKTAENDLSVKIKVQEPLSAPLAAGQVVGKMVITAPGMHQPIEHDIVAGRTVHKAGLFGQLFQKVKYLIFGLG